MEYDPELVAKVKRLHFFDHYTIHATSKAVGLHRSTVRKIVGYDPPSDEKNRRPKIITEWLPYIESRITEYPKLPATTIFRSLSDQGYKGSVTSVRRAIRLIRPRVRESFMPMEVVKGEQGQVDWGHFGSLNVGKAERKLYLFVMVLSWSRVIFARFTFDSKTASFLELHRKAFTYFGGTPRVILYDNLKSAVIQRYKKSISWNENLLDISGQFGFEPRACNPYRGNEKGRVERSIRYIRGSFFEGRKVNQIDILNQELWQWLQDVSLFRPWPDDHSKIVKDQGEAEKEYLMPLRGDYSMPKLRLEIRSGKMPFIRFDLNDYSIPHGKVREILTLEADDQMIWIYHDSNLIAHHERSWSREEQIFNRDHFQPGKARYHNANQPLVSRYPILEGFFERYIEYGESLAKAKSALLDLEQIYGEDLFKEALADCDRKSTYRPDSIATALLRLEKQNNPTPKLKLKLPKHLQEFSITSHSLDQYDGL